MARSPQPSLSYDKLNYKKPIFPQEFLLLLFAMMYTFELSSYHNQIFPIIFI